MRKNLNRVIKLYFAAFLIAFIDKYFLFHLIFKINVCRFPKCSLARQNFIQIAQNILLLTIT